VSQKEAFGMKLRLGDDCVIKKDYCINCYSLFMNIRSLIKAAVVSKRFIKDLKNIYKSVFRLYCC
jgi:hypothetical protein